MHKIFRILLIIFISLCAFTSFSHASTLLPEEQDTIKIFNEAAPDVVYVQRVQKVIDPYFDVMEIRSGTGSGFIWDKAGNVVTNYHVVDQSKDLAVTLGNGQTVPAKIVGTEPRKDIAVIKLVGRVAQDYLRNFQPAPVCDSSQLQVGQKAIAIGNPFGLDRTLTTGVISAVGRRVPGAGGISIYNMIQTDASINPGNSGGPLLNSSGELIGMNTVIYSRSGTSAGIGFAVPSNTIKRVVNQLIEYGHTIQPGFGVHLLDDQIATQLGAEGVIVGDVFPGTPAQSAGLRGTVRLPNGKIRFGDIIIDVDGQAVKNYDDLYNILERKAIGTTVRLTIMRDGQRLALNIQTVDTAKMQ